MVAMNNNNREEQPIAGVDSTGAADEVGAGQPQREPTQQADAQAQEEMPQTVPAQEEQADGTDTGPYVEIGNGSGIEGQEGRLEGGKEAAPVADRGQSNSNSPPMPAHLVDKWTAPAGQKMRVERTQGVFTLGDPATAARVICDFFVQCLQLRKHPQGLRLHTGLMSLAEPVNWLLRLYALRHGALQLVTDDMEITVRPWYMEDIGDSPPEDDMSIPMLQALPPLQADDIVTVIIRANLDVPGFSRRFLSNIDSAPQQDLLVVKFEPLTGKDGGDKQTEADVDAQAGAQQSSGVVKHEAHELLARVGLVAQTLSLPAKPFEEAREALREATSLWLSADALVAHTLVIGTARIIVGTPQDGWLSEDLAQLKDDLPELLRYQPGSRPYMLGAIVYAREEASCTHPAGWEASNRDYRDYILGQLPSDCLQEGYHVVLMPPARYGS